MAKVLIVLLLLMNLIFLASATRCKEKQVEVTGVEGQATVLYCDSDLDNDNLTFTWTKDNRTLESSPQITIQGQILWLLNTTSSDSGLYVCQSSNSTFSTKIRVLLSVKAGPCWSFSETDLKQEKDNITFSCSKERVPVLGERLEVQWWKDCRSTGVRGNELNLFNVSMSSQGNYTCMVIFRYEDKNYTVSFTYQLEVLKKEIVMKPQVLQPRDETLYVKPGMNITLECNVFVGIGEDSQLETSIYWMINYSYAANYPGLKENLKVEMRENSRKYGRLTLFIPEIVPEFFGVPVQCIILNPNGNDVGQVWFSQDDYTTYIWLIIAVLSVLAVILGAVLLHFFRIDFILAYRHFCGKDKKFHEGNQYNAFVLYLHGTHRGSSTAQDFALRILPSVLEHRHNLRLFIHGQDTDTEAAESTPSISDVLSRSKVVMLILPGSTEDETLIPLSQDQNRLEDSQLSALLSDITDSGVPLVLVESGENADYSLLPESIESSIKKGRVLKWKPTVQPDGRFWKHLRYHMT